VPRTRLRVIAAAAASGAEVWAAYAVVESLAAGLIPFLVLRAIAGTSAGSVGSQLRWLSPLFTLVTLVAYPAAGALLGAAGAGVLLSFRRVREGLEDRDRSVLVGCMASYGLLLAFAANALVQRQRPSLIVVGVGLVAVTIRLSSVGRPAWRFARAAGGKWSLAVLLAGGAYMLADVLPHTRVRPWLGLSYSLVVLLAGALADRLVPRSETASRFARWASLLALAALGLGSGTLIRADVPRTQGPPPRDAAKRRPNVVLITLDSVRADHLDLSDAGAVSAPNLRRLASQATVYTRAMASSNQTLSTHASIFTGLRPDRHGARPDDDRTVGTGIRPDVGTLPMLLSARGYNTCGIAANPMFLDAEYGFGRGFGRYESPWLSQFFSPTRAYLLRQGLRGLAVAAMRPDAPDALFLPASDVNARAEEFLRRAAPQPAAFFLFLNYMDAHVPYVPPPPYDTRRPGKMPDFEWDRYAYLRADVMAGRAGALSERQRQHLLSQYDGGIAYLDYEVGRLLDLLRGLGAFDDALIIVTSDHGEAFGEDRVLGHGVSLHQHQVHVPLLIKYPHAQPGDAQVVSSLVSSVDLLPTILDSVGAPSSEPLDGVSLRALGEGSSSRSILAESFAAPDGRGQHGDDARLECALFEGSMKAVRDASGGISVYDLSRGREERLTNLPAAMNDVWNARVQAVLSSGGPRSRPPSVTSPERDVLRSLGYIGR
jgi:arylsulfatase A-like enzyme